MAGDVVQRSKPTKGGGLRRPKRRISIRIDMTPMVDIAFLLLIFYMVTTVFSMPQAMEINLPPVDEEVDLEIKESNLLTLRVDGEGRFWWNMKRVSTDNIPALLPSSLDKPDSVAYKLDTDTLQGLLVRMNRFNEDNTPRTDPLNTLILIHRDASYSDMVNILDEIDLIERSWNYSLAESLDKKVEELTKDDGKFSYRYAMDEWSEGDNKKLAAAVKLAQERGEL